MTKTKLLTAAILSLLLDTQAQATGSLTCQAIPLLADSFLSTHVAIKKADEKIYKNTADQMIKRLDPSRILLLQPDIDQIKPKIESFLRRMKEKPDCTEIESIKNTLVSRAKEQLAYAREALGDKYKLDESAEFQLDPKKRPPAKDIEESRKRQMVQIHFQISTYLLSDMKLTKAKEKLIHRYELTVKRMEELKPADLYDFTVDSFAAALDPHSNYLSPADTEDFRINMQLSLEGIGASLSTDDGYTVIEELIPGGSAAKSNLLLPKDKIIAVGQDTKGEAVDVIDMDLKNVVRLIRGKAGTSVRLTILREKPNFQRLNVTLVRSKVQLEDDAAKVEFHQKEVDGKKYKLARLELPGFYGGQKRNDRSSYKDVLKAVEKARKDGAEGLLFDLTTNSGGLLDEAVKIAGLFISQGNVVATRDSGGDEQKLDDIDSRVQFPGPVVVLVSRLSASASEIVAGALQDYKRAIVVGGDHTYGKGSVQAVLNLAGNYGIIKVTTGLFYLPGGNSTQHRGVSSDIAFPSPFSTEDIGEKHLDHSLPPGKIGSFLSSEANFGNLWTPVSKAEVEKLKILSQTRVAKNSEMQEVLKDLKEMEGRKGLVKLSELRKKEAEQKKKNKDKAPKQIAKERNKTQIDEALHILADFVHLRNNGSGKLLVKDKREK